MKKNVTIQHTAISTTVSRHCPSSSVQKRGVECIWTLPWLLLLFRNYMQRVGGTLVVVVVVLTVSESYHDQSGIEEKKPVKVKLCYHPLD